MTNVNCATICPQESNLFDFKVEMALMLRIWLGQKGVNFSKILCATFCTKVFFAAFLELQFGFVIFWHKNIGAKAAYKMLMKLTTGRMEKSVIEVIKISF